MQKEKDLHYRGEGAGLFAKKAVLYVDKSTTRKPL